MTTYQDLPDEEEVKTLYTYGNADGTLPTYGEGAHLVQESVLVADDPGDQYAVTKYYYFDPLLDPVPGGLLQQKEECRYSEDARPKTTMYTYNDNGYKTFEEMLYSPGTSTRQSVPVRRFYFDEIGQMELEANERNLVTHNYYDGFGRIYKVEVYEDSRPVMTLSQSAFVPDSYADGEPFVTQLSVIEYGYDPLGNRTFEKASYDSETTVWKEIRTDYTTGGLPEKTTYQDDSYKEFFYDGRGLKALERVHDAGAVEGEDDWRIWFGCDGMGRPNQQIWYDYDNETIVKGQISAYNGNGKKKYDRLYGVFGVPEKFTDYEYDILDRTTKRTVDKGTGEGYLNLETQYDYDDVGNLIEMTDPEGHVIRGAGPSSPFLVAENRNCGCCRNCIDSSSRVQQAG